MSTGSRAAIPVLAVHYLGLVGMQPQPNAGHSLGQRGPHLLGLTLGRTVQPLRRRRTFQLHGRELALQPGIEGIVHEQVARTGDTADPCGVPRSRSTKLPVGHLDRRFQPALHIQHTHFWSVLTSTALTMRSWSTSRRISGHQGPTPSPSASTAHDTWRPPSAVTGVAGSRRSPHGRWPPSGGSSCRATTVWAILSVTVGIPSILVPPPCGFGISTARTGGGKYVPDDIR